LNSSAGKKHISVSLYSISEKLAIHLLIFYDLPSFIINLLRYSQKEDAKGEQHEPEQGRAVGSKKWREMYYDAIRNTPL